MLDWIFETPWWLLIAIVLLGVMLIVMSVRRQDRTLRNVGIGVIGLAIVLALLSFFIDTASETVEKRTRLLVDSVENRDWNSLNSLLAPRASLTVLNSPGTQYASREQIVEAAQAAVNRFGLKDLTIISTSVQQTDSLITSTIDVWSEHDVTFGRPLPTTWQFEWRQTPEGWQIVRITNLKIGQDTGDQARQHFPAPR